MKLKNNFFRIKSSLYIMLLICLGITMTCCEEDSDLKLQLAVNSNDIVLKPEGGSTHIMVYSTGKWTASFKEPVKWASIDKIEGEGNTSVLFSYSENLEAPRRVSLILTCDGKVQQVNLVQDGITPSIKLPNTATLAKNALPVKLDITSNLRYTLDEMTVSVTYDDELSEQWVTEAKVTEKGLEFYALENNTGSDRTARIIIKLIDGNNKEYTAQTDVKQTTEGAYFTPVEEHTEAIKFASTETALFTSNIENSTAYFTAEVQYNRSTADWISNIVFKGNTMNFDVLENVTGASRNATIKIKLSNASGEVISMSYPVIQTDKPFRVIKFSTLRSKITGTSGEFRSFTEFDAFEGIVISDAGNPNMGTNPNTNFSTIDLLENEKTAYIQALDGSFGFRIKTSSAEDNVLTRYSKVQISLEGLVLTKEADPERYTLSGMTAAHIRSSEAGTATDVISKSKRMDELTDADIYTFVELTNAEFALPYGSYFNANVGYSRITDWSTAGITAPRFDVVPTLLKDNGGNSLNVLTNLGAPWARNTLPTGSGTVKGVLVHDKLLRYGPGAGDIGKYSLRILEESAISLNNAPQSTTLVEWNWIGATTQTASTIVKNGDGTVTPKIGTGSLYCTVGTASPTLGAHPIFHTDPTSKAVPASALQYNTTWWNTTTNSGEAFVCKFSTSGISGNNLTINFSQGGGSGSNTTQHVPVYWEIEYSTDGANFTVLPNSTYGVRPLTVWAETPLFDCPGLISHSFKLPSALFGQGDVYVKLKVKDNICGTMTGAENGKITATTNNTAVNVRVGVISIKYN